MEASTVVIKVNYGDILRRFNAKVVDGELDLRMGGLTEKILSLFNFAPDTEIILTYIDEDGDSVALVDDDDLCDVVKQSLNPVRISVKLDNEKNGTRFSLSTGTSTPSRSPRVKQSFKNPICGVSEILKTVPEPLCETLVNLVSKVSYTAPGICPGVTEIVKSFSKVGTQSDVPESNSIVPESKDSDSSRIDPKIVMVASGRKSETQSSKSSEVHPELKLEATVKNVEVKAQDLIRGNMDASYPQAPSANAMGGELNSKGIDFGQRHNSAPANSKPRVAHLNIGKKEKAKMITDRNLNEKLSHQPPASNPGIVGAFDPLKEKVSAGPPQPVSLSVAFERSRSQNDCRRTLFHRDVCCDGCGADLITSTRFKSKVKVDYGLCRRCFTAMGIANDYFRTDYWWNRVKPGVSQLCSRFIQDVDRLRWTAIAPLTPFTKIWSMKNNGTVAWPQKTQLVWIFGEKLSNLLSLEIEIPATGLAVEHELDVAVDFIAPGLPGLYISCWRMASPSGQKFGDFLRVVIQVDDTLKEAPHVGVQGLNLNLPLVNICLNCPEISNAGLTPLVEGSRPKPDNSNKMVEIVDPVFHMPLPNNEEQEMKFPIIDNLLVGNGGSSIIDLDKEVLRMNEYDLEQAGDDLCGVADWDHILNVLEEMGFHDTVLNKKLLKKKNGSIKRVVMDLIAGEEKQ